MSEQEKEFDVEGHRIARIDDNEDTEGHRLRATEDEDTEGHRLRATEDEDTEGHRLMGSSLVDDDEDVEGHRLASGSVQPPRDTDLGGTSH